MRRALLWWIVAAWPGLALAQAQAPAVNLLVELRFVADGGELPRSGRGSVTVGTQGSTPLSGSVTVTTATTGVQRDDSLLQLRVLNSIEPAPVTSSSVPAFSIIQRSVAEVFADEQPRLLALPNPLPATDRVEPAAVDSQAFVRFDTNRYSVPSALAEQALTLATDDKTVRILDGATAVAVHPRSWGKRQLIELPEHRAALIAERKAARDLKGRDRLRAVAPGIDRLLERWALGGRSLAIRVTRTIKLLDLYGDDVFAAAVADVVARDLADVGAIAMACEKHRKDRGRPVPVALLLPAHLDDADVVPHDLETYDE